MPEGKRSEPTILVEMVVEGMEEMYRNLLKEWEEIPFMQERIDAAEYKRWFGNMTPEQQKAEIGRIGFRQVLANLGMKQGVGP